MIAAEYAPRMKKLHEKHGPVVRLGPNLLDIDYPELVKVIYGTDGKWKKVVPLPKAHTSLSAKSISYAVRPLQEQQHNH